MNIPNSCLLPKVESWRSSGVFSEDVQNRIRSLLVEAYRDGESLDRQISSVKCVLSFLLAQQNKEHERISILRSAISPVKNIPPEILGEIFVLCGDEGPIVVPPQPHTFPWTLAHVCSRWRQVLWGTSEIWKDISIRAKPPRILSCDNGPIPTAVRSIISNTKSQVSLKIPRGINDSIVNIILSSPERFKTLDLAVDHRLFCKLLDLPHHSFRELESLKINLWGIEQSLPPYESTSFQAATNLRRVNFDIDDTSCYLPCILLLPWAQLTDVRICHMKIAPSTIYTILQSCTSLTTVKLLVGEESTVPPASPIIIHLPTLTSMLLSCHHNDAVQWDQFLDPFVLPSLDEFSLRTSTSAWSQAAFISLVHRSACRPRSISILDGSGKPHYLNPDDIYSLLQVLPSLVDFRTSCVIPPSTFHAMVRDKPVPNLTHIKCRVNLDGLASFAELMRHYSLWVPHGGVKSASIRCFMEGEVGDEEFAPLCRALLDYKKEGRDINVYQIDS